jgi:hypothetical protein
VQEPAQPGAGKCELRPILRQTVASGLREADQTGLAAAEDVELPLSWA